MKQQILPVMPTFVATLDNFIVGDNLEALFSLFKFCHSEHDSQALYLFGEPGCGKTHLLQGALRYARHVDSQYMDALTDPELTHIRQEVAFLAIDNISHLDHSGQLVLFQRFHRQWDDPTQCLLMTDRVGPLFLQLRIDLKTRISKALPYRIHLLTDRQKVDVLLSTARERGMTLKKDVAEMIIKFVDRDIPTLISWLEKIDRESLEQKRHPTANFVRSLLHQPL